MTAMDAMNTTTPTPRAHAPSPLLTGAWRRALVFGMGLSGKAAARLLLAHGATVVGVDKRGASELDLGALTTAGGFELTNGEPASLPTGIDVVVLSPGVPPDKPLLAAARAKGVPVIAEVELAFPLLDGPVLAITGSNGKSTTTALAGAMVRAAGRPVEVCGNIGEPLSEKVDGPSGRVFVVELSSFQLETIASFRPHAAALLNVSPDHLDRYPDMAAYAAAKRRIFLNQGADDIAVLNADDRETARIATAARRRFFSRQGAVSDGCYLESGAVVEVAPGATARELFRADALRIAGVHNLENAMAAALLARAVGVEPAAMRRALERFDGLPHRLQRIAEAGGVVWYDDSKGTNPDATVKSLEGFPDGSVHLILGGRNKGADPMLLAPMLTKKARRLYYIGEAAEPFERALSKVVPGERTGTLERAVDAAARAAAAGEVVVLSPACASFDQFRNYIDRGEQFQRFVRARLAGAMPAEVSHG